MTSAATDAPRATPRSIPVRDPRTGLYDAAILAPTASALNNIAERARRAQPAWAGLGFEGRIAVLRRFTQALEARRGEIAAALEIDTGRRRVAGIEIDSIHGALAGAAAVAEPFQDADWRPGRASPHIQHAPQWLPYPLVGVISPWNFPLLLSMIDAMPALVAGCAVIVKPSEVTPRFAAPVMAAIADIPELEDVLIFAPGDGATGQTLVDLVDCICFTGSVATGRRVAIQAAGRLIPAFLELGGKDPLIVLEGADLDAAATAALRGCALSTGQACQSIERIYVARPVHDDFLARLVTLASAVRLNWPDITKGDIGPIIFERQADILRDQIDDARSRGARILTGGEIESHGGGCWLRPTVIADVDHDMAVMRDETFGPLLPIMAFDTEEEAVRLANDGEYGLSGAVFAADIEHAARVGRQVEAGAISLNDAALTTLFYEAGKQSFKASGLGPSRMGADGLGRFLRRKALIANTSAPLPLQAFSEDAR
ncbi:acyl-CoA reductase-like NAD-dependent aldehyde dehydrogenase [Brevundimonas bullata]|uniref:Acyl-CoA reductase-like NAD-dependent aldehyde dehydrogenase n=1 Tax=Brevundimonas bullata TaxID=13160 RepID=A0A7W7ITB4_9CAUL|nr:aldehyde dehydrogenase family protein [Brevundimonas bullata]MBB4799933.1 acyl-CoA reductase-like NAD-dependent aldehyde dehydrogenase [Brevundimonas bullata]MBB6384892.1 acyl-CoA reductase-like NAD-dependent aldehyde dehydrogenase [Brevundimonas bullata]